MSSIVKYISYPRSAFSSGSITQNARAGGVGNSGDEELTSLPHLSSLGSIGGYMFSVDLPDSPSSDSSPPLNNSGESQMSSPRIHSTEKNNSLPIEFNGANLIEVLSKQRPSATTVALLKSATTGAVPDLGGSAHSVDEIGLDKNGNGEFSPAWNYIHWCMLSMKN